MGNITGAMVFQSAIPTSVGLVFAPPDLVGLRGRDSPSPRPGSPSFVGGRDHPADARRGAGSTAGPLLVGGLFYLFYLAVVVVTRWPAATPDRTRASAAAATPRLCPSPGAGPGILSDTLAYCRRSAPGAWNRWSRSTPRHPPPVRRPQPDQSSLTCFFQGGYVRLGEARLPLMTHAFLYGTGVFEGIRAYWNPDEKQLYALRIKEHIVRLRNSSKIMLMAEMPSRRRVHRDRPAGPAPQRLPGRRLLPAVGLQEHRGDRRQAPRPDPRLLRPGHPDGRLHRHGEGHRHRHRLVAPHQRHLDAVAQQDHGQLREPGVLQDRGDAQRLRRGDRPDRRRARLRGLRREPVHGPRRRADHAVGQRRHPRGHHPGRHHRDRQVTWTSRSGSARSTAASCTSPTRSSCAAPAPRCRRCPRSIIERSATASVGPISRLISKTYFDAVRGRLDAFRHWVTPIYTGE